MHQRPSAQSCRWRCWTRQERSSNPCRTWWSLPRKPAAIEGSVIVIYLMLETPLLVRIRHMQCIMRNFVYVFTRCQSWSVDDNNIFRHFISSLSSHFLDDISELKLNLPPLLMYLTEYLSPEFWPVSGDIHLLICTSAVAITSYLLWSVRFKVNSADCSAVSLPNVWISFWLTTSWPNHIEKVNEKIRICGATGRLTHSFTVGLQQWSV